MAELSPKRQLRLLNGIVNRIRRVGVELEGGWTYPPADIPIEHDGSVHVKPPTKVVDANVLLGMDAAAANRMTIKAAPRFVMGEIPTPRPGLDIKDVDAWIKKYYPQVVNETCGLHVHMSLFRKLHYQQLMTPAFTGAMVKSLLEWAEVEKLAKKHPIWDRLLNPNHDHCAHTYCGDKQVMMTKKDYHSRGKPHSRYTAINYCMGQHGTVECRLLPMMETPDQGIRAVMCVIDTTNKFLSKIRQKEMRSGGAVPIRSEIIQEFHKRIR